MGKLRIRGGARSGATSSGGPLTADRLVGATAWHFSYLFIQGSMSVVLFGALAHVLPKHAFAAAAVAQGVLVIAQSLGDFGVSQGAVTVLPARIAADPDQASTLLASAARAIFRASGIALLLALASTILVPAGALVPVALIAPAAAATVLVSGADGILRVQGSFRRPVAIVAAARFAALAAIPVAIATDSARWTCAAVSAGTCAGAIFAWITLIRLRREVPRGGKLVTRELLHAILPLGLCQLLVVLGGRADTLIAGRVSGLVAAAIFESAWRIYQLGIYAVGGFVTASGPFIADAIGGARTAELGAMVRRLMTGILAYGTVVGAMMWIARDPLAHLLAGSIGAPVAAALPALAILTPLTAVGMLAFFALVSYDDQRRNVLVAYGAGAVVNVVAATVLAGSDGGRGVVFGCAAGLLVTNVLMVGRLIVLIRGDRMRAPGATPSRTP